MSRIFDDEIINKRIRQRQHELKTGHSNKHEFTSDEAKKAQEKSILSQMRGKSLRLKTKTKKKGQFTSITGRKAALKRWKK